MEKILDYGKVLPQGMKAMYALDRYSQECGLESSLLDLIKLRASQINGCAYCVDMHSKDARTGGETEQRLYNLNVWRDTPYYTKRERAALAFTEAVTLVSNRSAINSAYEQASQHFTDEELVKLMIAIVTINAWNRFTIFGDAPGSYQPDHFVTHAREATPTKAAV